MKAVAVVLIACLAVQTVSASPMFSSLFSSMASTIKSQIAVGRRVAAALTNLGKSATALATNLTTTAATKGFNLGNAALTTALDLANSTIVGGITLGNTTLAIVSNVSESIPIFGSFVQVGTGLASAGLTQGSSAAQSALTTLGQLKEGKYNFINSTLSQGAEIINSVADTAYSAGYSAANSTLNAVEYGFDSATAIMNSSLSAAEDTVSTLTSLASSSVSLT